MRPWLAKLTMTDVPEFADSGVKQKLYFYLIANFIGVSVMLGFGIALALKGKYLIPITDFVSSALLLSAFIYLKITKKLFTACLLAAFAFMAFLLVHLISGGTDSSGPFWYFIFPPVALYLLGMRLGVILSLIAVSPAIIILIMLYFGLEVAGYTTKFILRFMTSYLLETFLFYFMESQRNKAQKEVKILSGLLPICSHCKKVRDDKGYWTQIESYIHDHSEAAFSHGICQECAEKYYPDMGLYDD